MPKRKNQRGRHEAHEAPNTDDDSFEVYRWEFPKSQQQQGKTKSSISSFANFMKRLVAKFRRAIAKDTPSS